MDKSLIQERKNQQNILQSILLQKSDKRKGSNLIDIQEKPIEKKQKLLTNQIKLKEASQDVKKIYELKPIPNSFTGITPVVSLDCEMVLCQTQSGQKHEIARVSIVNYNGHTLYDKYVKPSFQIVDYLTWVSGVTYDHIKNAQDLESCKSEIMKILQGRKVVGHTLDKDFECLGITINKENIRDLIQFKKFRNKSHPIALKKIVHQYLDIKIQQGKHSSVDDALATLLIYRKFEKELETELKQINLQIKLKQNQFNSGEFKQKRLLQKQKENQ